MEGYNTTIVVDRLVNIRDSNTGIRLGWAEGGWGRVGGGGGAGVRTMFSGEKSVAYGGQMPSSKALF